jgi:CRP-like cAMP-binding protein
MHEPIRDASAEPRNLVLAGLPEPEWRRVRRSLERVELSFRMVLFEPNVAIRHVYFPEHGIASIVGVMSDGSAIEVATVGYEGMVGLPVFLGADSMAAQCFVQIVGAGYRMDANALREEAQRGGALAEALSRYTQALFTQVAQSAACNGRHRVAERCARWLLHTHDRMLGDTYELTHQFLSQMLGIRRASVTVAAGDLQERGLITYDRGVVTIVDRAGLEAATCECYAIIQAEFERLMHGRHGPSPIDSVDVSHHGTSTVGDGANAEESEGD